MTGLTSRIFVALYCLGPAIAYSQTAKLAFEVASVRAATPDGPRSPNNRIIGGPGSNDPERITYSRVSMQRLIMDAHGVGPDQISGPAWAASDDIRDAARFDISAKIPPGTTKAQAAEMLRNLLAERFQLTLHRVPKDFSGYALVVSKSGSKLKESTGDPTASERAAIAANGAISTQLGKDGFPSLFPGQNMGGGFKDGMVRDRFRDYPLADLVQLLSKGLAVHVVDKTGLGGKYDFTLAFEAPGFLPPGFMMPLAPGQAAAIGKNPPDPLQVEEIPIVSSAMEKQIGLKLEAVKIPLDTLVIDRVERNPTEN
jgi:uncharacterized protein (TIGR03435 family)